MSIRLLIPIDVQGPQPVGHHGQPDIDNGISYGGTPVQGNSLRQPLGMTERGRSLPVLSVQQFSTDPSMLSSTSALSSYRHSNAQTGVADDSGLEFSSGLEWAAGTSLPSGHDDNLRRLLMDEPLSRRPFPSSDIHDMYVDPLRFWCILLITSS